MADLAVSELSDEDIQKLVAAGMVPEEIEALQKQLVQAQMLRGTPMPEMRGNGRVQTAANPMEFIGAGLQQYAGKRRADAAQSQIDALRKQQLQARQLFANRTLDTPFRRESQPFIQPQEVDPSLVKPPLLKY